MVSSMSLGSNTPPPGLVSVPLVALYQDAKVAVIRAGEYQVRMPPHKSRLAIDHFPSQETLSSVKMFIPALANVSASDIVLYTTTLPDHLDEEVLIPEGMWSDLAFQPYLKSVVIRVRAAPVVRGSYTTARVRWRLV